MRNRSIRFIEYALFMILFGAKRFIELSIGLSFWKHTGFVQCNTYVLEVLNTSLIQVPFYLAELTEKTAKDDRLQIAKASQAKLKVNAVFVVAHLKT